MDWFDIIFTMAICFFVIAIGLAIIGVFFSIQNDFLQQSFCEETGFNNHFWERDNEGYCYRVGVESSEKKYFICEPAIGFISAIGECKFLEQVVGIAE